MASTPRPATSTLRAVLNVDPLAGLETRLSTIAVENIGPIASAWAMAAIVPSRRSPSWPPVAGGGGVAAIGSSRGSGGLDTFAPGPDGCQDPRLDRSERPRTVCKDQ